MALPNDPLKKKLRPDEDVAGMTAPLPKPQGTKIGNLTLQPGSGADTAAKAIGGFFGGLKERQAKFYANSPEIPGPRIGAPSPVPAAQAATAAPVVRPDFTNVQASASTIPARNPASSAASAGATPPAGGVPAPVLKPGDVNTFTFSDGRTVSVDPAAAPAAGSVAAQSFGGLPLPQNTGLGTAAAPAASAAPAPTIAPTLSVPRPTQASIGQPGAYGVQTADANAGKIASTLEDAAFRARLRGQEYGSARRAEADILGTLAQLGGQRLNVAAGLASGDRDAATGLDRTALSETGANQRSALEDTGATARAGMDAASRERVAQIGAQADLQKPSTITDANGNLISVVGSTGKPVTGPDGKPVKPAQTKNDAAVTQLQAVQKSLTDQLQAEMSAPVPDAGRVATLREQLDRANASLGGGVQAPSGRPKNAADFIAAARAAGRKESDAELTAYFNKQQGK